jgi:hypothetical protein
MLNYTFVLSRNALVLCSEITASLSLCSSLKEPNIFFSLLLRAHSTSYNFSSPEHAKIDFPSHKMTGSPFLIGSLYEGLARA